MIRAAARSDAQPSLSIRRLGRAVAVLAVFGVLLGGLGTLIVWSDADLIRRFVVPGAGLVGQPVTVSDAARFRGFLVALLPFGLFAYAMLEVARLFGAFADGDVFEERNAGRLRRIGLAALAAALVGPLTRAATSVVLTLDNPPGQKALALNFGTADLFALIVGLALVAFARVFGEAVRLARENGEFI